jgi:ATP-dependent DNA helicase UvrD/PcrA
MTEINPEKEHIINTEGNILVTANPGTGKTLLLASNFLSLVKNDMSPERILCLTFTEKAKKEMEDRIIKLFADNKTSLKLSKLNIFTFHSFALDNIEQQEIISSNLLRFSIYKYLKDNEILNYGDSYLLDAIVPKMENLIRYLKTFGITPDMIDIEGARAFLEADDKIGKEEKDKFAEDFVRIFEYYEKTKEGRGVDYADLLISFLKLRSIPQYDFVLVDELQDVNKMEADIALKSGKQFFAVGDKKQAIFGFQGGSIVNFNQFGDSTSCILSQNFRSTDEILNFAKEYFVSNTKEVSHREELKDLKSADGKTGERPVIYEVERNLIPAAICTLAQEFIPTGEEIAIIARTNNQIMGIVRELNNCGINFSSTFFTASTEARTNIVSFLRGVLSNQIMDIKNAMFTPFFPISLQDAFEISEFEDLSLDLLYERCPEFQKLRTTVKTVEDLNNLFKNRIIPVAVTYGKEYLLAALKIQTTFQEALNLIDNKTIHNLTVYLQTADLLSDELERGNQVILSTVHKAKGREFDTVIYAPTKTQDRSTLQDEIVEAILTSKGINVKEELEEETLRINFVAFTRAKKRLCIVTEKSSEYLNGNCVEGVIEAVASVANDFTEFKKRAYTLFVNGEFDKARELLFTKNRWLYDYVKDHFDSIDKISFTYLTDNPYEYLVNNILDISEYSPALTFGSDVHSIAEKIIRGEECTVPEEFLPYKSNIERLYKKIREAYPDIPWTEHKFKIPLSNIIETDDKLYFSGKIDAVFRNGDNYLIVDWKTDKNKESASYHRQQLEAYRRAFSVAEGVDIGQLKVAIGFVGLRSRINMGKVGCFLDDSQPRRTAFETFSKRVQTFLDWKKDHNLFFQKLIDTENGDVLSRSIVEQYKTEFQ